MRLYFETVLSMLDGSVRATFRDMKQVSHLVLWTKEQRLIADAFHGLSGRTLSHTRRIEDGSLWQIFGPIGELLPELAGKEVHLPEYQDRVFRAVAALTLPEHVGFEYELTGTRRARRRAATPAASTPETSGWAVLVQKSLQSTKHSTTSKDF